MLEIEELKKVRFGDPNMSIKNIPAQDRFLREWAGFEQVKGQKSLSPAFWSIVHEKNFILLMSKILDKLADQHKERIVNVLYKLEDDVIDAVENLLAGS